jgi:hypothetical protein
MVASEGIIPTGLCNGAMEERDELDSTPDLSPEQ